MNSFASFDQVLRSNQPAPASRLSGSSPASPAVEGFRAFSPTAALPAEQGSAAAREIEPRAHQEEPQVETVIEDGKVVKIIVTCRCCERIEIDCAY